MVAIFKRDFRSFFNSLLGYVYVGAFIFVMNLMFVMQSVLSGISSLAGVFSFMLVVLMFTTPILTMRSFSEEFKLKTDQLLLTSPVKLFDIVIGKFLAAISVFGFVMVLTLLWVLTINIYGTPNSAEILGNYFSMFCVAGFYIAVGIFISSLTENQLIAALGTLGTFVAMFLLDMATTSLAGALPSFMLRALQFISIFNRYGKITSGLLDIADIMFFVTGAFLFLFLSLRVLEKKRWS